MLEIKNLKRYYKKHEIVVKAVDDISFTVARGEFVGIVGASGSGKSTLLHLIGGLDFPTGGNVLIDGTDLYQMNDDERTIFRRRTIGFIFQSYNLLPMLNIYENIVLPIGLDGEKVSKTLVKNVLEILSIEDQVHKMPNELSGGQQQRVAIARSLVTRPSIILADEPTGNLDSKSSTQVMKLLKRVNREMGNTILMITHNDEMAQATSRILKLEDGKLRNDDEY